MFIFTFTIASIIFLLSIAGLCLADRTRNLSKYILTLLCFSAIGSLIDALPEALPPPQLYDVIGKFISAPQLGLIWWFSLSLLKEDFRLNTVAWLGMCVSTALLTFEFLGHVGLVPRYHLISYYVLGLAQLAVILHVFWESLSGLRDDLINPRRVLRLIFICLPVSALLLHQISHLFFDSYDVLALISVVYILPVCVFWFFWLTQLKVSKLDFAPVSSVESDSPKTAQQNHAYHARLIQIMEQEKAYLAANLTVGQLAERVGIPAHHLRTLINREMGFRNFAQFLASYRIKAIKAALSDPEQTRTPILTLALNGGFSSQTTFNRTFRAETGQSAGEFRKATLGESNQS
jgi:AraC-like DNA-binding protein